MECLFIYLLSFASLSLTHLSVCTVHICDTHVSFFTRQKAHAKWYISTSTQFLGNQIDDQTIVCNYPPITASKECTSSLKNVVLKLVVTYSFNCLDSYVYIQEIKQKRNAWLMHIRVTYIHDIVPMYFFRGTGELLVHLWCFAFEIEFPLSYIRSYTSLFFFSTVLIRHKLSTGKYCLYILSRCSHRLACWEWVLCVM